jgi:hypothetical protein
VDKNFKDFQNLAANLSLDMDGNREHPVYRLYVFFWVIPRRLNFISRRFETLCSIFIGG